MPPIINLPMNLANGLGLAALQPTLTAPISMAFSVDQVSQAVTERLADPQVVDRMGTERADTLRGLLSGGSIGEEAALHGHIEALLQTGLQIQDSQVCDIPQVRSRRIFVPNRGEAASRLINAARELSAERGEKLEVVVMYTDFDKDAPFVADADIAIRIPPEKIRKEPVIDEKSGDPVIDPETNLPKMKDVIIYNDLELIREVIEGQIGELKEQGHEAAALKVWPGWGFISETEGLSSLVASTGAIFLGPSAAAMREVGDKIGFKRLADPENVTWSGGPVETEEQALEVARRLGYPVVIKATAGGGGKGIKFCRTPEEVIAKLPIARDEARAGFKDPTVFIEKAVLPAPGKRVRHIEIQVLVDHYGNIVIVGDRDCSIQRDNQKIVEEAPAPGLTDEHRRAMYAKAIDIVRKAGYRGGAATVEGLFTGDEFQPMELNARLQVEHTITEIVTGKDMVKEMIAIGEGKRLSFLTTPPPRGTAFEIRINAEDPDNAFTKTGGTLNVFRPPTGPGLRTDTGVREGSTITVGFDAMVAKQIAFAEDRPRAIARAKRALRDFMTDGVITNRSFAIEILDHPDFTGHEYTTKWLEEVYMPARKPWEVKPNSAQALIIATVMKKRQQDTEYQDRILKTVAKGRPSSLVEPRRPQYKFSLFGHEYETTVQGNGFNRYVVSSEGGTFNVSVVERGKSEYEFTINGQKFLAVGSENRGSYNFALDGVSFQVTKPADGEIEASSNGNIKKMSVAVGDKVRIGDELLQIEAMKMAQPVLSNVAGIVDQILIPQGKAVKEGELIVRIRQEGERPAPEGPRVSFGEFIGHPFVELDFTVSVDDNEIKVDEEGKTARQVRDERRIARERLLKEKETRRLQSYAFDRLRNEFPSVAGYMRQALLGYGVLDRFHQKVQRQSKEVQEPTPLNLRIQEMMAIAPRRGVDAATFTREIVDILNAFVDVTLLFQREAFRTSLKDPSLVDQFYDFLKTRQATKPFSDRLLAALRHYGVTSLDASPALDQALVNILTAHEQIKIRKAMIQKLLRSLEALEKTNQKGNLIDRTNPALAPALEKFTRLDRDHNDLTHSAEGLIFSFYDAQIGQVTRSEAQRKVEDAVAAVKAAGAAERAEAMENLANLPDATTVPMMAILHGSDAAAVEIAHEALFRRLYQVRHDIQSFDIAKDGAQTMGVGVFRDGETNILRASVGVCTPKGEADERALRRTIADAVSALERKKARNPELQDNVLEIVVPDIQEGLRNEKTIGRTLEQIIGYVSPSLDIKRITFTIGVPEDGPLYLTFRKNRTEAGLYEEDPLFRWIHPFQAAQIELWRLRRNFDSQRIRTPWDGVYLLMAREKGGRQDRRLFSYSIVTSLSESVQAEGVGFAGYREVDFALGRAVHAIREAKKGEAKEADNHRVHLIIRPDVTATEDVIHRAVRRLAYKTGGLGIQQTAIRFHRLRAAEGEPFEDRILIVRNPGGSGIDFKWTNPLSRPDGYIRPMTSVDLKTRKLAQRRLVYPYAYINGLIEDRGHGAGSFREFDVDNVSVIKNPGKPEKVSYRLQTDLGRAQGENKARIVIGTLTRKTKRHPEGIEVVQLASDPSMDMGSLEEPECARIIAAIDYAEAHGLEVDWKATSGGAGISMKRGTENLDWTARVAKRIGEFCDGGGKINILVDGVNVGAQAYWNAIATMLTRRKGLLIMTPEAAMVLTGNEGQKISGSVAADSNVGLGGAEAIMGPNGDDQYFVPSVNAGSDLLWAHRDLTHKAKGQFLPALWPTVDSPDRDLTQFVYAAPSLREPLSVGQILADEEKKSPFPVAAIMTGLRNSDAPTLPRWTLWDRNGANLVQVEETVIGEHSVMMVGIDAQPMPRKGEVPVGGSPVWNASTLFPEGSKKMARAINAASGQKPLVILANLSGFDGSPESLANNQLEWGAEIEEGIRKFQGPIVFVVVTRYHGGAYVVFSKVLNHNMTVGAVRKTYASVIGGNVAVKVVLPKAIDRDTELKVKGDPAKGRGPDPDIEAELIAARSPEEEEAVYARVRDDVEREYLARYDGIHTVGRAKDVGSIDEIFEASEFRPWVIRKLSEGRRQYLREIQARATAMADSLHHYFSHQGDAGMALWEGMVRAAELGPYLPMLRELAGGQSTLPETNGNGHTPASRRSIAPTLPPPDDIAALAPLGRGLRRIDLGLPLGAIGATTVGFSELSTTMQAAHGAVDAGFPMGTVIVADAQTNGRGREGRQWDSPPATNLYLTAMIDHGLEPKEAYQFSYAIAAAVADTVGQLTDVNVQVKWPNDIFVEGKKISGILIEPLPGGGFAVGIGLNVNAEAHHFRPEVAGIATSLQMTSGKKWDRENVVLKRLLENLQLWTTRLQNDGWLQVWNFVKERLYQRGKQVSFQVDGQQREGTVTGIASDGALMIQTSTGVEKIYDGDVDLIESPSEV